MWTNPDINRLYEKLASFSRVLVFDKVGTGVSDPIDHVPTLEERAEDIATVTRAVGWDRFSLFAESEAGPNAIFYAATNRDRVEAMVIFGSIAQGFGAQPRPGASLVSDRNRDFQATVERLLTNWGKGHSIDLFAPSIAHVATYRRAFAIMERSAISPTMALALIEVFRTVDVTGILPTVGVPTLVLHRTGDWVPIEQGRYLAANIPGATFVELAGDDHLMAVGDADAVIDETRRFLTSSASAPVVDRSLLTVLFTDIVDSTRLATEVGDGPWRHLLEHHLAISADAIGRAGGRLVKSTGDGVLAVFPGPARAIDCATRLGPDLAAAGIVIRAGIHSGECELIGEDVAGVAVHVGARIAALAGPGEILTSSTVKDLVLGSGIRFADRGTHHLKGLSDAWRVYSVEGSSPWPVVDSAADHMRAIDRITVRSARSAPGALRALANLAGRKSRSATN